MSGSSGQEKTEAPTPQKIKQARDEGNQPRTQDLSSWASVAAMAVTAPFVVGAGYRQLAQTVERVPEVVADPQPAIALALLQDGLVQTMLLLVPLVAAAVIASVASYVLQGLVHPAWKKLKPDPQRINPLKGFKRTFSLMTLWEGAKTLVKATALVLVAWWAVSRMMPALMGAGAMSLGGTLDVLHGSLALLLQVSIAVGVVMAAADYAVQKRKAMKDLRMTKQEVKEESKNTEGDPLVKQARRSRQLAMSRNRMMAAVADADVVVVNPTHYAVALRYDAGQGPPKVVAKGVDALAARIRERAGEHRVPMVEDKPLARALHAACEVGDEIPGELFEAVAHVLAFVMQLRLRGSAAGTHRDPRAATATVPDGADLRRGRARRRRRQPGTPPPPGRDPAQPARSAPETAATKGSGSRPVVPRQQGPGRRTDGHGTASSQAPTGAAPREDSRG